MILTDYELAVMREIAEPGSVPNLRWGAGMGAALEKLQGAGLVTRGECVRITEAGRAALAAQSP